MGTRASWLRAGLRLLMRQPGLLADHLGAHGALLAVDAALLAQALERRLWLTLLSGLLLACGIVLAGMAAMLWLLLGRQMTDAGAAMALALLGVPLLPWLGAAWAWQAARRTLRPPFENIRTQLAADLTACRDLDATGASS
ncbi:MAG: hypothetical protein RLZZ524_383 [Pseudomonadota bacterium]|jgi:ABC-type nickel/cobalt efflux system permease component RcnA